MRVIAEKAPCLMTAGKRIAGSPRQGFENRWFPLCSHSERFLSSAKCSHFVPKMWLSLRRFAQRAAKGCERVRFVHADAQVFPFEPASFDAAFSRFGVMFFADPTAAFINIRRGLRPSGRLAFVCWRALEENPL